MSYTTKRLGASGEDVAAEYLIHTCGYGILYRNFRSYRGEIDIIAQDRDIIVFIEVKTRRNMRYGRPLEAVSPYKQDKIRQTATSYLSYTHQWHRPCRFDVMEIMAQSEKTYEIHHIRNAF